MSDAPDVHDAQWLPADLLWIAPHLRRLSALGYVVVKVDGLQHGDELVRYGRQGGIVGGGQVYVKWVRRSVSENGDNHD